MSEECLLQTFDEIRKEAKRFKVGDKVEIPKNLNLLNRPLKGEILDITDYFLIVECIGRKNTFRQCYGFFDAKKLRLIEKTKSEKWGM